MPKAKKNKSNMRLLVEAIDSDTKLLSLLQMSHLPGHQENFSTLLNKCFAKVTGWEGYHSKGIYSDLLGFLRYTVFLSRHSAHLIHCRKNEDIPTNIAIATNNLWQHRMHRQQWHKQLTESLGLTPKTKFSWLKGVPVVELPKLENPYPPPGKDIFVIEEITSIWRSYCAWKKHPDDRGKSKGKWPELEKLDETKLSRTVGPDESIIIRDKDTGRIALVVLRNFSGGNDEVLDWGVSIVDENVGLRRGIWVCLLTAHFAMLT